MGKYLTHFQTEAAYQAALPTLDLPNVSLVDELGEVHYHHALYGAHAGDICLYDVAEGQKFFVTKDDWNLTSYPTASYPIVGIAVADETATGVTLCSAFFMAADGSTSKTEVLLKWQNDNFDWGLTKYTTSNASTDFNGKTNTATIISAIKAYDLAHSTDNLTGCVGGAIQAFAVTGTSAGDWYVGAAGEVAYFATNQTIIKATFDKIEGQNSSLIAKYTYNQRATSTEVSSTNYITCTPMNINSIFKTLDTNRVRPFLKLT